MRKKFVLSSSLYSYYEKDIDVNEVESIDEIIILVVSELDELFKKNNLEILSEELHKCRFHIHDYTYEVIRQESSPAKFYICDHDH